MNTRIIGSHACFFREGDAYTVPGSGTSGRAAKPGAADTGWIDLGVIKDAEGKIEEVKSIEIMAPAPGKLVLYDELSAGAKLTLSLTLQEMGPLVAELLYRSLALTTSGGQFNPLEGLVNKRGWLKLQCYDQDAAPADEPDLLTETFVKLKVNGSVKMGGGEPAELKLDALVLHSTLNTGQLGHA